MLLHARVLLLVLSLARVPFEHRQHVGALR
jgi:hypothetical protein